MPRRPPPVRIVLTPELERRICDYVRAGNYLSTAAEACGITANEVIVWRSMGKKDIQEGRTETRYASLFRAVALAEAQAEAAGVMRIRAAAQEDWRAEAWYLERRYPERWLLRQTFTVEAKGVEGPLTADFVLSDGAPEVVDALFDAFDEKARPLLMAPKAESNGHGVIRDTPGNAVTGSEA